MLNREGWAAEKLDSIEDNIVRMNHAFNLMDQSQKIFNASLPRGTMKHALQLVDW